MRRPARALLPALLALALSAPLSAQAIRGRVVDAATGAGVEGATVTALGPAGRRAERARTAVDGSFALEMDRGGTYRLQAERLGYRATLSDTLPLYARETVEVTLRLSTEPLALEALTVTARREPPRLPSLERRGFYERERMGMGRFIRREDFVGAFNRDMATLLSRQASLHTQTDARGKTRIFFNRTPMAMSGNSRGRGGGGVRENGQQCQPKVYLDGTPVTVDRDMTINEVVSPEQVEAIELFRSASEIPVQYRDSESGCGVILIWSRGGDGSR